tara:strand:- start:1373 stop:1531 length:159 start_codon:yes stop_codon:yes gene_type:complete
VKNELAGLLLWNDRTGAAVERKAVFEAPASAEVSLKGWRIVKAILEMCCVVV